MHNQSLPINSFRPMSRFQPVARVVGRVLLDMSEPAVVEPGSREFHQAEAMRAAQNVQYQYTREAKKQAKCECLGHLIASLAPNGAGKNKAPSA